MHSASYLTLLASEILSRLVLSSRPRSPFRCMQLISVSNALLCIGITILCFSILFQAFDFPIPYSIQSVLSLSSSSTMAWRCSGRTNAELIQNLFTQGLIQAPRVRDAMSSVDRAHYCPSSPQAAYEDSPQPIGYSATISAPHMHASACESLLPFMPEGKGAKVLDIGSGSGYLTHVLANIVCGPDGKGDGKVVGIDHIKGLVDYVTRKHATQQRGPHAARNGKSRTRHWRWSKRLP